MPKYQVLVPHLEVEVFEVEALDPDDAVRVWREAAVVLEPVRSFSPVPGPAPRAELIGPDPVVVGPEVLKAEAIPKCGKCGSPKLVSGKTDTGVPAMICRKCGAVGVGGKL